MESIAAEIAFMATSAGKAFVILMDPMRLLYLSAGCLMGLVLGIVPGIGGLAGTAMLLPFTFNMDPYSAFALLLGLGAPRRQATRFRRFYSAFRAVPVPPRRCSMDSRWPRRERPAGRSAPPICPPSWAASSVPRCLPLPFRFCDQ